MLIPDHPGIAAAFPAPATGAAATARARLGTFVRNAAFWNPVEPFMAAPAPVVARLSGT